jgi:PD-(D/E)XK endonuclease
MRLFEEDPSAGGLAGALAGVDGAGPGGRAVALGKAAEMDAIGRLLRLGHRVAVPVCDDDGVDLVVDYRVTVQVKSTGCFAGPHGYPMVSLQKGRRGQRSRGGSVVRSHVDVFAVYAVDVGWWVIPREAMPRTGLWLGPRYEQWREAWEIFGRV